MDRQDSKDKKPKKLPSKAKSNASFKDRETLTTEMKEKEKTNSIISKDIEEDKEGEAYHLLDSLKKSAFYQNLPAKTQRSLVLEAERRKGKVHALQSIINKERGLLDQDEGDDIDKQKFRESEAEDNRLGFLWEQRSSKINWTLLILFHATVLANLAICLAESYRMLLEDAKFDRLLLDNVYNCLNIVDAGDALSHFINIFHGFFCVVVLFSERTETVNIYWGLIFFQMLHAAKDTFQYYYGLRFPPKLRWSNKNAREFIWIMTLLIELVGAVVLVQRVYDVTNLVRKRTSRHTSSIYGGRLLNEQIIFQNESVFLQKKYTLRQATALQIYGIVQRVQHHRNKGLILDSSELHIEITAAIQALTDVQSLEGIDVLKELKKRNVKRLREFKAKAAAVAAGGGSSMTLK